MELSPEERQRIYLEEKARVEARKQLEQETSKPSHATKPKKSGRLIWWILGIFGVLILGSILESKDKLPPAPKTPAEIEAEAKKAEAVQATFDACNEKLEKAKELGMLYDVGGRGATPQVLVGPTYFTVPIDAKKGFAEVVNCVLVKGSGGGMPFELIHWQTGKRVATWNGYKLVMD